MIPYWGPLSEQTQPMPHPTPRRADFTVPRPRPPTLALYFIGRVIDVWSLCQSFITERSSFKGGSMFWMMDEQGSLSGKLHCNCSCIWHAGYERRFEWTFMAKGCSRITHALVCTYTSPTWTFSAQFQTNQMGREALEGLRVSPKPAASQPAGKSTNRLFPIPLHIVVLHSFIYYLRKSTNFLRYFISLIPLDST